MRQGIVLLNLLLVAGVGLLGQRLISNWRQFQESTRQEVYQRINRSPEQPEEASFRQESARPFNHYLEVHERNLFNPERRPEEEVTGAEELATQKPPPLPIKPTLHGVSTIRGEQRAFLTVFAGKKNQGESRTVMLGDMVQGYRVGEITPTTVTLVWNHHTELIDIMDSRKGKQPKKSAGKQAGAGAVNIVTVGSTRAAVETVAASVPPAEEAVRAAVSPAAGQQRVRNAGAAARGRTTLTGRQGAARGRTGTARRPVYGSAATRR
ncbi:MAG: hypothetical protein OXH11_08690 [Candidatus Aminicenantes bacterium]|nr:hypothetical protein [Candidatus Aminicenantes bacterium]